MTIEVYRHGLLYESGSDEWTFASRIENINNTWKSSLEALDALSDLGWEVVTACVCSSQDGMNRNPEYLLRKRTTVYE